jgi:hypothetical protein
VINLKLEELKEAHQILEMIILILRKNPLKEKVKVLLLKKEQKKIIN